MKSFTAGPNENGVRLSRFVEGVTKDMPRSMMYKAFRNKRIKVNGKRAEPDTRLQTGDLIELYINELTSTLSPYIKRIGDMGDYIKPIIETMIITHIHSLIDCENHHTVVLDSYDDDEVYYTFELDCEIASDTRNVYKFPKKKMDKINKDNDFCTTRLFDEEETDKITGEVKKKLLRIYRNEQKKKRLKRS